MAAVPVLRRFDDLLRRRPAAVLAAAATVACLPLLVAVVVLRDPTWYPVGDLAQAAMRQESFWRHPPLVGTAGRIGTLEQQGNHPGPAMFWAAWPLWKLLGSSAWALQVASVAVVVASLAAAVLLAFRAFGARIGLAVAAAGAVLVRAFGPELLTQPWNPYTPLVPYFLFVVACWTTASGRHRHLPVAVLAGSYVVQCHVGYAPAAVLGIITAVAGLLWHARAEGRHPATETPRPSWAPSGRGRPMRTAVAWVGAAAALGVVVWLPPLIQELTGDPGNLSIILETYGDRDGLVIGARQGIEVLLTQLDPFGNVLRVDDRVTGAPAGGAVLLGAWAAAVAVAAVRRHRRALDLHVVLGAQLVAMVIWSVRLDSIRFPYLVQWFWVVTVLLVAATALTFGAALRDRLAAPRPAADQAAAPVSGRVAAPAAMVMAAVVVLVATLSGIGAATDVERPFPNLSDTVDAIDDPTAAGLDRSLTYRIEWQDGDALGAVGFGLLLELERRGFDVGAGPSYRAAVEPHRTLDPDDVDAVVTVVSGEAAIEAVRAAATTVDGARELVAVDARSASDRARADRLRGEAEAGLLAAGRPDLVDAMARSIWTPLVDPSIDDRTYEALWELVSMGRPTAVFVSPGSLAAG